MNAIERRQVNALLALVIFVLSVIASIAQRSPYIGTLTEGHHQFLTADQIKFVEYWTTDGVFRDRFLTIQSPLSIETPTIAQRGVYASFIPGDTLQIYVLHLLLPAIPIATLISVYGIALQIIVAFVCGLIVWRTMKPDDRGGLAIAFVISAMLTYVFHPAPYYFHPMVQFGYQIALVPFVVATWLEYEIRESDNRRLVWFQTAVIGWFAAVDWMFIPFCLALTFLRLVSPLRRRPRESAVFAFIETGLQIWLLPTAVCLAFALNLYLNGYFDLLLSRAMLRTGVEAGDSLKFASVYKRVFVETLSNTQVWIHAGALVSLVYLIRNRRDSVAVVSCLSLLSCYLYVILLPNDVYTHDFESLKFFVVLAIVPFGIAPYRLIWSLSGKARLSSLAVMVFLWSFYMIHYRTSWPEWYQDRPPATQQLAEWLRDNAKFDEVYLSDEVEIPNSPPVPVAISRKRVWLFNAAADMRRFLASLPSDATVRFVSKTDRQACFSSQPVASLEDGTRIYAMAPPLIDCLAKR